MTGVTFSPSARRDLLGIFEHIAADKPGAALGFIERVESACGQLSAFPEMGALREVASPARICLGRYVILYRPKENGVDIVRVVHGARDLPSLLD